MKRKFILFAIAAVLNGYPLSAQNEPPAAPAIYSIIKGKITDSIKKKPISGAKIIFDQIRQGTVSNAKGEYEMKLQVGPFVTSVRVVADGYNEKRYRDVVLNPEQATVLNVELEKTQKLEKRIFHVHYRNPHEIARAMENLLSQRAKVSTELKTISEVNTPAVLKKIANRLQELDVPFKKIWLEVTIVRAFRGENKSASLPAELNAVAKQLTSLFKFNHYEVIGKAHAFGTEGSVLRFSSPSSDPDLGTFNVQTRLEWTKDIISLKDIKIQFQKSNANYIETTVNIKNDETLILGVSQGPMEKGALLTVVKARVLD
ncbi:MAG: carboxypeptidase regulatory-like domain-containing protein [bacterium]